MGFEIEGLDELIESLSNFEKKTINKVVNKASRQGAKIALQSARMKAPVDTGTTKRALQLKAEKTKLVGKKVFQVGLSQQFDGTFVVVRKNSRVYYPNVHEYGGKLRNGNYMYGLHFMRDSITENNGKIESTIVNALSEEIDKL